jgi:DNA-binding CsgD family transcriptional regulator
MEARVFELIVKGHTTKEIAAALSIAPSTLKTHTLRLFDKTGRRRRSELVRLAAQVRPPG